MKCKKKQISIDQNNLEFDLDSLYIHLEDEENKYVKNEINRDIIPQIKKRTKTIIIIIFYLKKNSIKFVS